VLGAPNDAHRARCLQYVADVEAAIEKAVGSKVPVVVMVDGASASFDDTSSHDAPTNVRHMPAQAAPAPPEEEEEVDLSELVDVPPESVQTPTDALLQAFPGSQLIEE